MRPIGLTLLAVVLATTLAVAAGKPGYPDKVVWSGATWAIKTSRSAVGPGPNVFDKANVSVDAQGRLQLRIAKNASGAWTCAEVIGPTSGPVMARTPSRWSRQSFLDSNVVLGDSVAIWERQGAVPPMSQSTSSSPEWGNAADVTNSQLVVQPYEAKAVAPQTFTAPAPTRPRMGSCGPQAGSPGKARRQRRCHRRVHVTIGADVPNPATSGCD